MPKLANNLADMQSAEARRHGGELESRADTSRVHVDSVGAAALAGSSDLTFPRSGSRNRPTLKLNTQVGVQYDDTILQTAEGRRLDGLGSSDAPAVAGSDSPRCDAGLVSFAVAAGPSGRTGHPVAGQSVYIPTPPGLALAGRHLSFRHAEVAWVLAVFAEGCTFLALDWRFLGGALAITATLAAVWLLDRPEREDLARFGSGFPPPPDVEEAGPTRSSRSQSKRARVRGRS